MKRLGILGRGKKHFEKKFKFKFKNIEKKTQKNKKQIKSCK